MTTDVAAAGFDPARIGDEESDGEYVRCPICRYEQGDAWEWVKTHERQDECPGCGTILTVWAEYDITYYARVTAAPRDSDGNPQGGDSEAAPSRSDDSAGPQGIAQTPDLSSEHSS